MSEQRAPIFVLCYARSGSTLVRYILDTHPEIAAPPELHLLLAARRLAWVYEHTARTTTGDRTARDAQQHAIARTRYTLTAIMEDHASRAGKRRWAEKSVSSLDHLDVLQALYPTAAVICLHRAAADVMASCAQAAQLEQGNYGFEPFVARTPGNVVDGLADYWVDRVRRSLDAEHRMPNACLRIRYEDLVAQPEATVATLFEFLGTTLPAGMLDSVLTAPHVVGPGDSKILSTTAIHRESIGHGARLSLADLAPERRANIDALHAELGYAPL